MTWMLMIIRHDNNEPVSQAAFWVYQSEARAQEDYDGYLSHMVDQHGFSCVTNGPQAAYLNGVNADSHAQIVLEVRCMPLPQIMADAAPATAALN